ncbi:TonB-dependent siderophore receptor [Acinetobacter sp. WCHAc010034]|uniref:TonB-dependent siderophore receptor n=1 Tax=Acinetobacter sp. WCHAc010034 TaxID=1879049 RepID=UPI000A3AA296|nr:TonB-dependent receptor [Acinetobacter sp. WCHAc010034]AYA03392.1 TonB-dependent siderophore receptor [Acinetobacter sp. WCHAc010034]
MTKSNKPISFVLKPIVLSIHIALAAGLSAASMSAFSKEISAKNYQIAAGDLSAAVNQFAIQSGVALSSDNARLSGLKTAGLKGTYTVEQGLQKLLENTPLQAKKINQGYVLADKASSQKASPAASTAGSVHNSNAADNNSQSAARLDTIVVTASSGTDLAGESKNNYTVSRSSSATKLDLALKDTPQSITVITNKQIEEQALTDVNKVLESTPGVTVQNYGVPGAGRTSFYSRGYEINNVMVDGAPTLVSGSRGMELLAGYDTVIYDRVEITRGSSGLSTGTGDPSASLNFVRKRPGLEAEGSAKVSYGRWNKKRVELDVSQPFTDDAGIRGRFVAAYGQGDSYIDRIKEESKIFYGIVEADLGDKTTVAVGGTWFDKDVDDASPHMTAGATHSSQSVGVFDGGRSWNAATDWSYAHTRSWNGFFTINHQLNDAWKLATNYQYSETAPDRLWGIVGADSYNATYNTASYNSTSVSRENTESKIHNLDISLLGKFDLFGREAQIATGINGYQSKTFDPLYDVSYNTVFFCKEGGRNRRNCINLDNWNGNIRYPDNNIYRGYHYDVKEKQYGYFFSTKFEPLQDLKLILGARYNKYNIGKDTRSNTNSIVPSYTYDYKPQDKWIPYAGLIYDINDQLSAYASYTGIYKTQLEKDINDQFLPFIEGNSYELGLKSALFDDQLNLHTAIFRMKELNTPYRMFYVPKNPDTGQQYSCTPVTGMLCDIKYAADGPIISGFEMTAQGKLTDQWLINAGYTYLHVERPKMDENGSYDAMLTGDNSYERPKHAISLSTSYQIMDALTIGGSARWKYKTTQGISTCLPLGNGTESCTSDKDKIGNLIGNQGSFTVLDLMARYQINENFAAGLNINNLFDKTYKKNRLSSLYGEPRNIAISLSAKF